MGTAVLIAVLVLTPVVDGLLVTGLAAYIAGRQVLFPMRGLRRVTSWGRITTLVAAVATFLTAVALLMWSATG